MHILTKTETIAVGLVVGILCPLLSFILFWWVAASLSIFHVLPIPESGITAAAFTGLGLGILIDARYLGSWIPQFYSVELRVMALVYLGCSLVAVASFMGLPLGNLILGTLAGVYVGRRQFHTASSQVSALKTIHQASLFTALVTGTEALAIGLLALGEDWVIEELEGIIGVSSSVAAGWFGIGLVVVLCAALMIVQFWCTSTTARISRGLSGRRGSTEFDGHTL